MMAGRLEDDPAAGQAAGPRHQVAGEQRVPEAAAAVAAEPGAGQRATGRSRGSAAGTSAKSTAATSATARRAGHGRGRRVPAACGGRPVVEERRRRAARRCRALRWPRAGTRARGGRHERRGPLLLAVEAGHDRREPRTSGEPQAERLAEADPAQPVGVHAGLPRGEQPATQVPGVVGARVGHREAEVGDQVAEHRHHRRDHDRHDRQQGHEHQQGGPAGSLLGGLVQPEVVPQAQRVEDLAPGADHGRGDDHPGGGERRVPEPPRLEPGDQPRVVRSVGGLAYLGRDGRCSRSLRSASAACTRTPSRTRSSSPSLEDVPVPILTVVSPSIRWISEALTSTVRTRSIGVDSTCLLSRPRRSSTRPSKMRKLVVRYRAMPRAIGTPMPSTFHHHSFPPERDPASSRPSSTGRKRISSRMGCTRSISRSRRCHSRLSHHRVGVRVDRQHLVLAGLLVGRLVRCLRHVASPGIASALRVSSSTRLRARSRSSPAISRAPAADAVVAVTEANRNSREIAPST